MGTRTNDGSSVALAKKKHHESIGYYTTWHDVRDVHNELDVDGFRQFMRTRSVTLLDDGVIALHYCDYQRWLRERRRDLK